MTRGLKHAWPHTLLHIPSPALLVVGHTYGPLLPLQPLTMCSPSPSFLCKGLPTWPTCSNWRTPPRPLPPSTRSCSIYLLKQPLLQCSALPQGPFDYLRSRRLEELVTVSCHLCLSTADQWSSMHGPKCCKRMLVPHIVTAACQCVRFGQSGLASWQQ